MLHACEMQIHGVLREPLFVRWCKVYDMRTYVRTAYGNHFSTSSIQGSYIQSKQATHAHSRINFRHQLLLAIVHLEPSHNTYYRERGVGKIVRAMVSLVPRPLPHFPGSTTNRRESAPLPRAGILMTFVPVSSSHPTRTLGLP